jgi:Domain of unknown function (DUF1707)
MGWFDPPAFRVATRLPLARPAVRRQDDTTPDLHWFLTRLDTMSGPDDGETRARVSDEERDRVAELVNGAVEDGRLTRAEGDERLAGVHAAVHHEDLDAYIRELEQPRSEPEEGRAPGATGSELPTSSFSLMRNEVRRGQWAPGPVHSVLAFMGGVELDLRDARLDPRGTTIRAVAIMGGIVIVVGPEVEVQCEGRGLMGGFGDVSGPPTVPPSFGAPPLHVTGLAAWGGVEIRRRKRDAIPPE